MIPDWFFWFVIAMFIINFFVGVWAGYKRGLLVGGFRFEDKWMEEVTNLTCKKCEIPLRINNKQDIYCPYCRVHNRYELVAIDEDGVECQKVIL